MKYLIAILLAAICLTGCQEEVITARVIERSYTPANYSSGFGTGITSKGHIAFMSTSDSTPEKWVLIVQTDDETFSVETDAAHWAATKPGDSVRVTRSLFGTTLAD